MSEYEYYYDPQMGGIFKKLKKGIKRAFTPPKKVRKAIKRALTPPKKVRKALARAFTPPKAVRRALLPPKSVRKLMKRNPWLDKVISGAITAAAFLPIPGARVVSAALDIAYTVSQMSMAENEQKKIIKAMAREEAAIVAQENALWAQEASQGVEMVDMALEGALPFQVKSMEYLKTKQEFPWWTVAAAGATYLIVKGAQENGR